MCYILRNLLNIIVLKVLFFSSDAISYSLKNISFNSSWKNTFFWCAESFSHSKHPSKRDYHSGKVEGLHFGEDVLEQGMSWPSQNVLGHHTVVVFRFQRTPIPFLYQRGLSTIKEKNVLSDKICLVSRQICDGGFDKRSLTCTSRRNHLGKFWMLTTLFSVSHNTISVLQTFIYLKNFSSV